MSRALNKQTAIELEENEKNIAFLASISSAAPFLGLFGTVWGIMNAFQNIATSQSASLSVVAPGISEALITTAIGIGTAIPAVLGYNFFIGKNRQLATRIDCFSQDLLNLIERSSSEKKK
jgi:biopolymer transport protein TolQ